MVGTACRTYGCHNNSSNNPNVGFYHLPGILQEPIKDERFKLAKQRRHEWLTRINRKDLSAAQLREVIPTLRVYGAHLSSGKPAVLYETKHVDWAPSINLGYKSDTLWL